MDGCTSVLLFVLLASPLHWQILWRSLESRPLLNGLRSVHAHDGIRLVRK